MNNKLKLSLKELNKYEISESNQILLSDQLKTICEELESNNENVDIEELVLEVMQENDVMAKIKKNEQKAYEMKSSFAGSERKFISEEFTKLKVTSKFAGIELDFSNYQFPLGDIEIEINNSFGGLSLYVNENISVDNFMGNVAGGVEDARTVLKNPEHKITITGKNKFGGVDITNRKHGGYLDGKSE